MAMIRGVKCKNLAGPWQEVEIRAFTLEELNRTEFWDFLKDAVNGFEFHSEKAEEDIESHMPWKKLGRQWHYSTNGFSIGETRKWDEQILNSLEGLINEIGGEIDWSWDNKDHAKFMLKDFDGIWGSINTKTEDTVPLVLYHSKDLITLDEISKFGASVELDSEDDEKDYLRIDFNSKDQLEDKSLQEFLEKHLSMIKA